MCSEYTDALSSENTHTNHIQNYIEMLSAGSKRTKYMLNDQESLCTNDSNETRNDFHYLNNQGDKKHFLL
jgi:hypothetical protein